MILQRVSISMKLVCIESSIHKVSHARVMLAHTHPDYKKQLEQYTEIHTIRFFLKVKKKLYSLYKSKKIKWPQKN